MNRIMNNKNFFTPSAWRLEGAARRVATALLLCVMTMTVQTAWAELDPVTVDDYTFTTGSDDDGEYYVVDSKDAFEKLAAYVEGGGATSRKRFKMTNNIYVSETMVGTSNNRFCGTFDGNHKTLTLNYGTAQAPIDAEFVAPFVEVSGGATFINLNIDGHIYAAYTGSSEPGVGGLIGRLFGGITIEGCTSTVEINSTKDRVGGFVGLCEHAVTFTDCVSSAVVTCTGSGSGFVGWSRDSNYTIAFYGCLFNGKVLKKNGVGSGNGGFIGWKGDSKNVTITNCLVDPAPLGEGETMANGNSATFSREHSDHAATITNCYYTETFGNAQGTKVYSISKGQYVTTLEINGTATQSYTVSGLSFYSTGIKYGDVLYAAENDVVSLTLGCTPPAGFTCTGYTATSGNLNGTTLTMPHENVTINVTLEALPAVSYLDASGNTQQCTAYTLLDGTETSLGTADQETWYVADGTINFNQTINVNGVVHLILKDNAVMNVGTEQNPISDSGISAEGPSISIYGQSTGSDIGMLSVYATYCGIYDYDYSGNNNNPNYDYAVTINGGNIFVSASSYGIQSNKVTINGGQVWATAGISGIASYPNAITLGWTSPYDLIYADAYQGDVIVKSGKAFINNDNPSNNVVTGTVSDYSLINGMFLQPAVAVTLNDGITAGSGIISSGENLYAKAAVDVTVDASSVIAPPGYAVSGITVTPTVTVTNNGNGTYSFTTPAADVTVSATIELQPVSVNYLDENGVQHTVDALPLLGGGATTLAAGWYVVNSDISYTGTVSLVGSGDVKLILADDHTMNVGTSENRIEYGIKTSNNAQTLTIYGQSTGNHMGILSIYTSHYCIYPLALTINGGHVIANADGNYATALRTTYQTITINGGTVEATATGTGAYAIHSGDNFTYAGGTLITNAASENAIKAYHGRYTFTWRNPSDRITIGSTGLYNNSGNATATFTNAFTDGTNIYSGTLTGTEAISGLAGKTLYPYIEGSVPYIDENGQRQLCTEYNVLNGNETTLGTSGQETWYVADGMLDYSQTINLNGDVHLILKDNAVMNVGTEETPINGHGIYDVGHSFSIYAQSTGESQGQLHLNASLNGYSGIKAENSSITINGGEVEAIGASGIYAENCSVNINSGKVTAFGSNGCGIIVENDNVTINGGQMSANNIIALNGSITINGGQVTANDINANANGSSVTINGGQVTANSIVVYLGNITLGWSNASDFIFAGSYSVKEYGTLSIAEGKAFITEDGSTYTSGQLNGDQLAAISDKTLYPYIEGSVPYIDENGKRQLCTQYTIFDGQTTLGTGWYVADGTHDYVSTITINGDVHLILKDNAVMNVGREEDPIPGHGIHVDGSSFNSSFSIYAQSTGESQGQLHVIAGADSYSDYNGIYAEGSSITINGGKVTVNGIYYSDIYIDNGSVTINGGQVYADIYSNNYASVTINGGQVTAKNIDAPSGVTINGGQVTANHGINAIYGNIKLGWTNPTDFIHANSYLVNGGTLSIAEGKAFIDKDGNTYSSTVAMVSGVYAINGKTLYPYIEGSVVYLDENGQRQLCTEYNVLNGTETSLGTSGQETWYVADGTLDYSQTITLNGDVHLILKDGAVMNVGTTENPVGDGYGITGDEYYSISIYAQSMGDSKGQLHVNAEYHGIYAKEVNICGGEVMTVSVNTNGIYAPNGNITIYNGHVTSQGYHGILAVDGDIIINGGQVTANGGTYGIWSEGGNLTINGGQVTANGGRYGIQAYGGNITLGWTNVTDFIYANSYLADGGTLSIAEGKAFIDEDGNLYSGTVEMVNGAYPIDGKTLRPYSNSMLFLADDADNTAIISKFNGQQYNVTLAGRKLYKDGYWNTLCLPFNMTAEQVTAQLEPTELKELDTERKWANVNGQWSVSEDGHVTGLDNGTLYLNFKDADAISAGVPYIIKWASGSNIEDPVFSGVTIDSDDPTAVAFTGGKFVGTYSYTQYTEEDKSILFLGEENKLYWPQPDHEDPEDETSAMVYPSIGAFRAYFQLDDPAGVRAFKLNFGDGEQEAQGIKEIEDGRLKIENEAGAWYTLDGVKVNGKPTRKGLYIVNGKKVVIK